MNEPTIPQEVKTLAAAAPHFLERVMVVSTAEEMQVAMVALSEIKAAEKELLAKKKELLDPFNEGIKRINAFFAVPLNKLAEAKTGHDRAIVSYRQAEQQRVAEENRRRQEEVERQQAVLRANAAAQAARAAKDEQIRREKAAAAEAAGKAAQAAKLRAQADSIAQAAETQAAVTESTVATMVAPTVEPDVPKSDAGHFSSRSTGRVRSLKEMRDVEKAAVGEKGVALLVGSVEEDLRKRKQKLGLIPLICAIADGVRAGTAFPPPLLLKIDQKQMNDLARGLGSRFDMIPGCALETETSVVSKKR